MNTEFLKEINLRDWLGELIKIKTGNTNTTFFQLHQLHLNSNNFKDAYCTGTNITRQKPEIFSWLNTPLIQLKTAVHISGCIPLYFKPVAFDSIWNEVSIKKSGVKYDLYFDGEMLNNYPINIFDSCANHGDPFVCNDVIYNHQTIGLKLERAEQLRQFEQGITDIALYAVYSLSNYLLV